MYHKKAALYYDYFAGKEDIPFFRRLMLRMGGPVLEMGSGTGLIALDLGSAGLEVLGVDRSRHMLDVARSKWDKLSPSIKERVKFMEGDMINFPLDRQFSSALIARGSFEHLLDTDDQLRCLANVRKLLDSGGKLVVDLSTPSLELIKRGITADRSVSVDGDITLLRTVHIRTDLNNQRCNTTITYEHYKGGVLVEQVLAEAATSLIFPREALLLFRQTGFSVEDVYGDTTGGGFNSSSRRMIVVARK
jgi:SAM-dependent methyltransferase